MVPALPPPPAPAAPESNRSSPALWRRIVWLVAAVGSAGPLGAVGGLVVGAVVPAFRTGPVATTVWLAAECGALAAAFFARVGFRRGWRARRGALWLAVPGAGLMAALVVLLVTLRRAEESARLSGMVPSQPVAVVEQLFRENAYRLFVTYDEVIGPFAPLKARRSFDGEDLRAESPVRRGLGLPISVALPAGTVVRWTEVLAAVGRSGLVATYPRPQDSGYACDRVYRLDSGVTFRGGRVVDLPPDPAGREGRDADGVHHYRFPDGTRFEVTYRGGRVVAAWLIGRDGRRFDELKDGRAAQEALS